MPLTKQSSFPAWITAYGTTFLALSPKHCWNQLARLEAIRNVWSTLMQVALGHAPRDDAFLEMLHHVPWELVRPTGYRIVGTRSGRMSGGISPSRQYFENMHQAQNYIAQSGASDLRLRPGLPDGWVVDREPPRR